MVGIVIADCQVEVERRLGLARGVVNSLSKTVWRSRYLSQGTKIRVFRSLVVPVLLYSCEAWMLPRTLREPGAPIRLLSHLFSPSYLRLPPRGSCTQRGGAEEGGDEGVDRPDSRAAIALLWPCGTLPRIRSCSSYSRCARSSAPGCEG